MNSIEMLYERAKELSLDITDCYVDISPSFADKLSMDWTKAGFVSAVMGNYLILFNDKGTAELLIDPRLTGDSFVIRMA